MNFVEPAAPHDLLDAIQWSYRLFFGRDAESPLHVRQHVIAHSSIEDVRKAFMTSEEFYRQMGLSMPAQHANAGDLFQRFVVSSAQGADGFWIDFLGVRTRCSYLPHDFVRFSGKILGRPDERTEDIHDLAEWIALLRAVTEAKERGRFTIVELGAGWGPWLVGGAKAASIAGLSDIQLLGVEGAKEHVAFMRQHFEDNGIDPDAHRLVHGVVGATDGTARFPRLPQPAEDWGAKASYGFDHDTTEVDEVPCFSLNTILCDHSTIDLLHCDIQGAEGVVLSASAAVLNARVRRIVVGTHSREVEGRLIEFFSREGWSSEHESSCQFVQSTAGTMSLVTDGCQVWRNRALEMTSG